MRNDRPIPLRGFSLIELLMSIMILAIGLISVAALFPAGMIQQQRAKDDVEGPAVAKSALGLMRARMAQDDFGGWTDFYRREEVDLFFANGTLDTSPCYYLSEGDWPWMRPALAVGESAEDPYAGTVDVFNWLGYTNERVTVTDLETDYTYFRYCHSRNPADGTSLGIPYDLDLDDQAPPRVLFTQQDRSWPPEDGSGRTPQYFWDFMLCRSGGEVYAAVFVYRVVGPRGGAGNWTVVPVQEGSGRQSAVPLMHTLQTPWTAGDGDGRTPLAGTTGAFNPLESIQTWQYPGQWLVDNMTTVHRVDRGRVRPDQTFEDGMGVRLVNELPLVRLGGAIAPTNSADPAGNLDLVAQTFSHTVPASTPNLLRNDPSLWAGGYLSDTVPIVDRLWFVPRTVETIGFNGVMLQWELVPVYVTVERL